MLKKVLLITGSIFLIFQSYEIISIIHELETENWLLLILIAWIINMFITGIFALLGFALPTHLLLPKSYYKIRSPEILKKVCKILGTETFRKFLLATLWRNKNQRKKFFNGKKDGIAVLEEQSMKSEFGHLIPFIILNFIGVYLFTIGLAKLAICCIVINFIGNFYTIPLQRHHRMRIQLLRERRKLRNRKS